MSKFYRMSDRERAARFKLKQRLMWAWEITLYLSAFLLWWNI